MVRIKFPELIDEDGDKVSYDVKLVSSNGIFEEIPKYLKFKKNTLTLSGKYIFNNYLVFLIIF